MDSRFEHLLITRKHFITLIDNLTTEELNKVPKGFSNNIIWNVVHCMVTQQGLMYGLSGLEQLMSKDVILQYKHGTRPEKDLTENEITSFKNQLVPMLETTVKDYENGAFSNFKKYTTSKGYSLSSIEDSINLVNIHEGIHLGYALAIRKTL
ncbi:hypothetical protein AAU57_01395 [Nonlabens sp. YIK11]|uniref:DinB family protein n=1 Tax=Nonlabens sp. YIK11 TaxID=1453349 RepID=UPI0006DC073C|nr:DinB family protein [Nonlabens sp. YIK11]KQC32122.1 hypothetical protein AAU57_01395 [Nonlabens sp. YIK11]